MAVALRIPTTATDEELALAAASGSDAAFSMIYERHAERLFVWITRMIGPSADREDVLQKAFLGLHQALPSFRGDASLTTFLGRITYNVACDHLRYRNRRPLDYDDAAMETLLDGRSSPEERVRRRQELRELFTMLEKIKPAKRLAFVLIAVEGMPIAEAAQLIGASETVVRQRMRAARHELLELLARAQRRLS